jgi:hypothetical protein
MANPWDSDQVVAASPLEAAIQAEGVTGPKADFARSIYQQESTSGKNTATSNADAVGGMQVRPATFDGVADKGWNIHDPVHNARAGLRYASQMFDKAGGDPKIAAAGYYGGPGGLAKAQQGVAVSDPRNPGAPNTLQYGDQVASRMPAQGNPWDNDPVVPKQAAQPLPAAPAIATQPAVAAPAPEQSNIQQSGGVLPEIGRQLGLTARAVGHAAGDVASLVGNPLNATSNALFGTNLQDPGKIIKSTVDKYTPAPRNTLESGVNSVASAIANPVNQIGGGYLAAAKGLAQTAGRGAVIGSATGALQQPDNGPVTLGSMATGAGLGALGGGILGPVLAGVGRGVNAIASRFSGEAMPAAAATAQADSIMAGLGKDGIDITQIPQQALSTVRDQVAAALQKGQKLDPAALLRQQDFKSLGMDGTLGQVTRDPMQYAKELNMRGIDTGGGQNVLAARFNQQPGQLGDRLNSLGAGTASEAYPAGNALIRSLQAADVPQKAAVDAAYGAARDTTGRYANLDVPAFSKAANDALDSKMLGHFLPDNVRGILNDVSTGKVPLNVNTATQIDSVLSAAQRGASARGDNAASMAIGQVRDSLNKAPIASSAGQDAKAAFDQARSLAAQRFQTIDATPALKAALTDAAPDKFVSKYVINGNADDLKSLSNVISQDPGAKNIVRGQIAEYLRSKAFGANTAGDKGFAQESYNKALANLGTQRLSAFFTPDEINQFQAVGRVGSYMTSPPAGSAVNTSNTAGQLMNLVNSVKVGGLKLPFVSSIDAAVKNFGQRSAAQNALAASINPLNMARPPSNLIRLAPAVSSAGAKAATN